jgi:hypothetical protein
MQGNQSQLTVAVNRLQSEKVESPLTNPLPTKKGKKGGAATDETIMHATKHGHKLLFPTYDGADDPLP